MHIYAAPVLFISCILGPFAISTFVSFLVSLCMFVAAFAYENAPHLNPLVPMVAQLLAIVGGAYILLNLQSTAIRNMKTEAGVVVMSNDGTEKLKDSQPSEFSGRRTGILSFWLYAPSMGGRCFF